MEAPTEVPVEVPAEEPAEEPAEVQAMRIVNGATEEQLNRVVYNHDYDHVGMTGVYENPNNGKFKASFRVDRKNQRNRTFKHQYRAIGWYRFLKHRKKTGEFPTIPSPSPVDSTNDNVAPQDPMAVDAS